MKSNELRIGNLVKWSALLNITETEHRITAQDLVNLESFKIRVEPIPLTEEWLQKMGFVRLGNKPIYEYYGDHKNNFGNPVYFINENQYIATNGSFKYVFINDVRVPCAHVHTFQNLVFALTGEELEVKL